MNSKLAPDPLSPLPGRITSVDFFRGFTMFLLAGEAARMWESLLKIDNPVTQFLGMQLEHHKWNGLHFWDLIQPFFMFIVGVAIPFAVANRLKKGDSPEKIRNHAFKRAFLLLFFGWALYFIEADHFVLKLQNVLAQLSVTYIVAFLIRNKSFTFQLVFSLAILVLIDLAYRFFPVAGYDQPWVNHQNLGAWFNSLVEGTKRTSEWATLNFVSTTAHTIWGVMCGKLLMSSKPAMEKIRILIIAGLAGLVAGYSLDWLSITPIIKKIATSSFVLASGGWTILALCFSYWLIDVKKIFLTGSRFFIIVGMNSIFIYIFFHVGGAHFIGTLIEPFVKLFFAWAGELTVEVITSVLIWLGLWYICYWLYKNKVFVKI
jgi:predicted acyltransferase